MQVHALMNIELISSIERKNITDAYTWQFFESINFEPQAISIQNKKTAVKRVCVLTV